MKINTQIGTSGLIAVVKCSADKTRYTVSTVRRHCNYETYVVKARYSFFSSVALLCINSPNEETAREVHNWVAQSLELMTPAGVISLWKMHGPEQQERVIAKAYAEREVKPLPHESDAQAERDRVQRQKYEQAMAEKRARVS